MLQVSGSRDRQIWQALAEGDAAYMLALRFIAHLPYFKAASMLTLPQGLSTAGVVVTTLVYALACLVASRLSAGLRRTAAAPPHPAALPLLGTTAVLAAMLVMAPAIALLLPRDANVTTSLAGLLPACLALSAPPAAMFFAAQYLSPRLLRSGAASPEMQRAA